MGYTDVACSCKTVETIDAHHIRYYLERNHPIAICVGNVLEIIALRILMRLLD